MNAGRYIVRLGDATSRAQMASHGRAIFDNATVQVWSDAPVLALGKYGMVVGHLFTRQTPSRRVTALSEECVSRIIASNGQKLIDDYWGGYVAAIGGKAGPLVLRDPSGAMPCFFAQDETGVWLSNDAASIAGCSGQSAIDLAKVAAFLCGLEFLGRSTCVAGVSELWPGERLALVDGKAFIETVWTPWQHSAKIFSGSSNDAAAALRETLLDSVRCWAEVFPSILLGVSGGLDSSIVAWALADHIPDLRLLTMVGPDADGDETGYARLLADSLGLPLIVRRFELDAVAIDTPNLPHLPWPVASCFTQAIAAVHRDLESQSPIGAYFTGNGGDNIFCSMGSARPVADRLIAQGLSIGTLATALDVARLADASVPAVMRAAWRLHRGRRASSPPAANLAGLSPDWIDAQAIGPEILPWAQPAACRLPGKAMHVRLLARAMKGHELYARSTSPPQIAPLLAQPVVELCLAIPSWRWIEGGRDRAVARAAFADRLPRAIIERRSKGGPTGFMLSLYRRDALKIEELLEDGLLMQAKLLDRSYVSAVDCDRPGGAAQALRLLALAATESWVRHWVGRTDAAHVEL